MEESKDEQPEQDDPSEKNPISMYGALGERRRKIKKPQ